MDRGINAVQKMVASFFVLCCFSNVVEQILFGVHRHLTHFSLNVITKQFYCCIVNLKTIETLTMLVKARYVIMFTKIIQTSMETPLASQSFFPLKAHGFVTTINN